MNTKLTTIFSSLIILVLFLLGAFFYDAMPEQMASHWNANDEVDGYMNRFWGVYMMPLISVFILILFFVLPNIDPLKENILAFRKEFNLFIFVIIIFLAYIWLLTLLWNLGYTSFKMGTAILPALGFLFIFMGYLIRKSKRNWFIGIRTPWTLSSDTVWAEIHRIGGALFMISGFFAILGVFFDTYGLWFTLVPILGSTLFLYIYSYILYQREVK
ncbi:MAG: SdpI family protein [Chloroflexi bacterium]|nr:SdpI family protein [Chloroflexota bacterium]